MTTSQLEIIETPIQPRTNEDFVDIQVATAKRYPRDPAKAIERAKALACTSQEIAESCIYALPRAGKTIDGPSVRLAEIVASTWGNMRTQARPIDEGAQFVEALATAWDLESNNAIQIAAKRRITDKMGNRYKEDMIGVTMNAAVSIALRNAIFRVVPKSVIETVYLAARAAAVGTQQTLAARRDKAVAVFGKMGVTPDRVLARIERATVEDVTLDDLATLIAIHNQIREGDVTIEEAFKAQRPAAGSGPVVEAAKGVEGAKARVRRARRKEEPPPAEVRPPATVEAPPPAAALLPPQIAAPAPVQAAPSGDTRPARLRLPEIADQHQVNGLRLSCTLRQRFGVSAQTCPDDLAEILIDAFGEVDAGRATVEIRNNSQVFDILDVNGKGSIIPQFEIEKRQAVTA